MAGTYGWVGKLLRVDLTDGYVTTDDTLTHAEEYIGGRGLGMKLAWDELSPTGKPFDSETPLMFLTGPLTGTPAPCSGRTFVMSLGPQVYPYEWFTYSSLGGYFGSELKYAGYDGIIITGKARQPVYLWIRDDKIEIRDARHIWGSGTYQAQQALLSELGSGVRTLAIGQAGEHLSRIASINSGTESAAGQGGFGAVMGAKNLKAIAVRGTGAIRIARPKELVKRARAIAEEGRRAGSVLRPPGDEPYYGPQGQYRPSANPYYGPRGPYRQKLIACSQNCTRHCPADYYMRVPGVVEPGTVNKGMLHCVAPLFAGGWDFYDWKLDFPEGFEIARYSNEYGINHWELLLGIGPWLRGCREEGLLGELDGRPIDLNDAGFWLEMLRKMAYREGVGDSLAEGGRRLPNIFGFGQEIIDGLYAGWGFGGHWDGHGDHANYTVFPYWAVSILHWALASRDPFSSSHGYTFLLNWAPVRLKPEEALTWDDIRVVGKRVYGTEATVDPWSGYEDKELPAHWHAKRSILKDSMPICDWGFPRIFSDLTEDRLAGADGMEGPDFELHLFNSVTGSDLTPKELDTICERIANLERAILVRSHGRSRADDETVIPYFEREENWASPVLGEKRRGDRGEMLKLLDAYYKLSGWDVNTGRPTRAKLEELGLGEVAADLERRDLLPS